MMDSVAVLDAEWETAETTSGEENASYPSICIRRNAHRAHTELLTLRAEEIARLSFSIKPRSSSFNCFQWLSFGSRWELLQSTRIFVAAIHYRCPLSKKSFFLPRTKKQNSCQKRFYLRSVFYLSLPMFVSPIRVADKVTNTPHSQQRKHSHNLTISSLLNKNLEKEYATTVEGWLVHLQLFNLYLPVIILIISLACVALDCVTLQ